MSLFGTIQQSAGALDVAQLGLQVAGNNIANANTPGYLRQRLLQASAEATRNGALVQGQGVRPTGIVQVVDQQLVERLIQANTAVSGAETLGRAYTQLEELTGDLAGSGLNEQLSLFNNALHELSTQPGDSSLREFVILQAQSLTTNLRSTREDAVSRSGSVNAELSQIAADINRLTDRIARLNTDITTIEGGGLLQSDATGLRDQRLRDLEELSQLVNLNIQEQESGAISVFVGGDFLINNGIRREVGAVSSSIDGGIEVRILETDAPLQASQGRLAATVEARDSIFGDFVDQIDTLASSLIQSVNEVHSQGQGRRGFQDLLSTVTSDTGVPLVSAGLAGTPRNGSFDLSVIDDQGQLVSTHRIDVQILSQVTDSTVQSVVADIDSIDGISADVTAAGQIRIRSDAPTSSFTFSDDTSGFLATAGLNTFFTGRSALDIDVNPQLTENSDFLAISRGGIGQDTEVLNELVDLVDRPLDTLGGRSVRGVYEQTVASLGQQTSLQTTATEGLEDVLATLQSEHLAVTGVNIDEESINLITFQRAFQASSRVIATASELLDILVNL